MPAKKADPTDQLRRELARAADSTRLRSKKIEVGEWLTRYMLRAVGASWLATARAIYGSPLTAEDRIALRKVTRFEGMPRPNGYREALIVAGRRSGKSSTCAALAVYEAVENGAQHMAHLQPGQRGHIFIFSRTLRQSLEDFRYAKAIATTHFSDQVAEILESQNGGEIRFKSGIVISVMVASSSSLRGFTCVGATVDEAAFLNNGGDEESERDLEEILSSLRMAMLAPPNAPMRRLLVISSPGVRSGYIWEMGRTHAQ